MIWILTLCYGLFIYFLDYTLSVVLTPSNFKGKVLTIKLKGACQLFFFTINMKNKVVPATHKMRNSGHSHLLTAPALLST